MEEASEDIPLLPLSPQLSTAKIYGTSTTPKKSSNKEGSKPCVCNRCVFPFDTDGTAATCAAYSGEASAISLMVMTKTVCGATGSTFFSMGGGLGVAVCTFFTCRRIINEINNGNLQTSEAVRREESRPQSFVMKK